MPTSPDKTCSICGDCIHDGQYHDCDKPPKSKRIIWVVSYHGFGFGIWRSVMRSDYAIWTICIGPAAIYINVVTD